MDTEKIKEMLTKYWYIIAGVVVYMMFGKKKRRKSRRGTKSKRRMRAMQRANSRLKRQLMYSRMRRR